MRRRTTCEHNDDENKVRHGVLSILDDVVVVVLNSFGVLEKVHCAIAPLLLIDECFQVQT